MSVPLFAKNGYGQGETALYRFSEHLAEAKAVIRSKSKKSMGVEGVWQDGRFVFEGTDAMADIEKAPLDLAFPESGNGIAVQPLDHAIRVLTFSAVPPGAKLRLTYHVDLDPAAQMAKQANYIYLDVFLGGTKLQRLHIPVERGLKKQIIDPGAASFLKRKVIVGFEIIAEKPETSRLVFDAEMF